MQRAPQLTSELGRPGEALGPSARPLWDPLSAFNPTGACPRLPFTPVARDSSRLAVGLPHLTERSTCSPSESLLIIVTRVGDTEVGGSPISNQKQALIKSGEVLRSYCPGASSGINKPSLPWLLWQKSLRGGSTHSMSEEPETKAQPWP